MTFWDFVNNISENQLLGIVIVTLVLGYVIRRIIKAIRGTDDEEGIW